MNMLLLKGLETPEPGDIPAPGSSGGGGELALSSPSFYRPTVDKDTAHSPSGC